MLMSLALLFAAAFMLPCHAQLRVIQPHSLASKFDYKFIRGSTAAFGIPLWGEQLIGKLHYSTSTPPGYCSSDSYAIPETEDGRPRIILIERGDCHFVTKVRIAQDDKNAAAVLIIDDPPSLSPELQNDFRPVLMADDGFGYTVQIPSIIIPYDIGQTFKAALEKSEDVVLELSWNVSRDLVVQVDAWLSPSLSVSLNLWKSFAPYARQFKQQIKFFPHYWIFNLNDVSSSLCIQSGKFCALAPDWSPTNITGADIVHESLRQICLWQYQQIEEIDDYGEQWWSYVEGIQERCLQHHDSDTDAIGSPLTKECSYAFMEFLGVDTNYIKKCETKLGDVYLAAEARNRASTATTMMINGARLPGPADAFVMARAICTGYFSPPPFCSSLEQQTLRDYIAGQLPSKDQQVSVDEIAPDDTSVGWHVYVLITVLAIILCAFSVYIIRRFVVPKIKSRLRYQVFEEVKAQLGVVNTKETPAGFNSAEVSTYVQL